VLTLGAPAVLPKTFLNSNLGHILKMVNSGGTRGDGISKTLHWEVNVKKFVT